jgi:GT2 family glycosyltransferase/glycosyltransferase involved in cell wall biosynthesis
VFGLRATAVRSLQKALELLGLRQPPLRASPVSAVALLEALSTGHRTGSPPHADVDIIVPIFNGFELLQRCVESLLRNSENCHVLLLNDASTDPRIDPYLRSVSADAIARVTIDYLENETNLGFVTTVNRGLRMATHDVVILNTDTEIPRRWLDRIMAPIGADPGHVASVTPMSNAATLCSFPEMWIDNLPFLGLSPDTIDSYFERYGQKCPVEVPSGVGFCMAMSRAALDTVGVFDQKTFGRGYGEENDWCMRAQHRGFTNLVTPNLYVYHHHGGSFDSKEKTSLQEHHQLVLRKRYPELFRQNEDFSRRDPLSCSRLAVALKMIGGDEVLRPLLMLDVDVSPGVPSGAVTYRDWLARSLAGRGRPVLVLTYDPGSALVRFRAAGPGSKDVQLIGCVSGELESQIGDLIGVLAPAHLLATNLIWYPNPESIAKQVLRSKIPYLVFAHDFCSVCPSWFLVNKEGKYCGGETRMSICNDCLPHDNYADFRDTYPDFAPSVSRWRTAMGQLLTRAERVVCFSESSLQVLTRVYPTISGVVIPHVLSPVPDEDRRVVQSSTKSITVAIIGSLQYIKGLAIVHRLVQLSRSMRLPVRFVVVGTWPGYRDDYISRDRRLRVTGTYRRDDLPRLLEESGASLVMIPSIWPETFSYTTSEAILLGYPVVCFDLGAPAERIRAFDCGMVVEDVSAEGMLGALKHVLAHPELIRHWSLNTAKYHPPTEAEHIDAILECLDDGGNQDVGSLRHGEEAIS